MAPAPTARIKLSLIQRSILILPLLVETDFLFELPLKNEKISFLLLLVEVLPCPFFSEGLLALEQEKLEKYKSEINKNTNIFFTFHSL